MRRLSGRALVVAQETEFLIPGADARLFRSAPERPELYFSPDFKGYGWIFRKQDHVNIGIGSLDSHARPAATRAFVADLQARGLGAARRSLDRGTATRISCRNLASVRRRQMD